MKIGYDAKRLYCNFTGLGNYSRTLLRNLREYYPENEYFLYTPKVRESTETNYFLNNSSFHTYIKSGKLKSFWRSYGILNRLKKDNIDIYHGLSHEIPFYIKKSGVKSIVTIHDLIFKIYPKTYKRIDRNIYDLKFKYACLNADKIIAISESTKKDIIKYYGISADKIDVIYQTCSPIFFKPKEEEEIELVIKEYNIPNDYLLFVGSVIERKNVRTILESYRHISSELKFPIVIVGGGGKYKEEMIQFAKNEGLENLVFWVNNLFDNDHLQCVYQKAKAFLYPSVYEGFGIPVVEALLSKTPVITSNVSSLPEAAGPDSLLIDPINPIEMAKAIEKVLEDSDLREKMINGGYEYALNTFSPKKVTDQLIETYKKVMG